MNISSAIRLPLALAAAWAFTALIPEQGDTSGLSLFPPVAAILVAITTGRLILGLTLAILGGAIIALPADTPLYLIPLRGLQRGLLDFIWSPLRDSFQLFILGFTASLIGMVRVISLAGGTRGIAELLIAKAAGARSTRMATALLGLAIFFDDYANTLVVGTTMRPITDRFRISREKLAFLVDSTAAPVAGIAIVSTWVGFEVGLFDSAMNQVQSGVSGYELFFRAMPARFYCLLTLAFVFISTALGRDYGPMLTAERRAQKTGQVLAPDAQPPTGGEDKIPDHPGLRAHWAVAAAPVLVVVFGVLGGMHLDAYNAPAVVAARTAHGFFARLYWIETFANADGAKVMFIAALLGSALAMILALTRREESSEARPLGIVQIAKTWVTGITGFSYALVILVLAWAIKETCEAVETSAYIIGALSSFLDPNFLPLIVFLLAAAVAFSIGTSWTTMAILLPTMVPVAYDMGGIGLTVLVAAAVLDGAIFGDHCSPISDTTVLSSIASSCDHLAHVRTQAPYALTTMAVAGSCGYLGSTLLWSPAIGLVLGLAIITAILLLVGKKTDED
ncbi:MAG TPA: Na+/H+ antiporter NhaC family protein [Candidatus Latescibacteria bacterium]|nr:Na+/H+ antiporter NhaC family protein [Candidatus Handelsmanbacteria bacterium]HIL07259.1 Na+/H+ antiporter NhaC family protein [Candidatus Latescibacterota bacterium]